MFASQLLKLLQSVADDAENESCVDDLGESNMTMKENQTTKIRDSKCFTETELFNFGSKDTYKFKDSSQGNSPPLMETARRDECCIHKDMDDFSISNENDTADSLSSNKFYKDKEQRISEHECLITAEDSRPPCSDLFQAESDSELPELEVCYTETDHRVMKDICIDEGRPKTDKTLVEHRRLDDRDHCKAEDGVELELFISGELEPSLLDDPWKARDAKSSLAGKTVIRSSEDRSVLDKNLPVQEFGTRSFLRSFLCTLDSEVNNAAQLLDQVPNGKAVSKSLTVASVDAGLLQKDVQASSWLDNNRAETGNITSNFKEVSAQLRDLRDHTGDNASNLSDDSKYGFIEQVQLPDNKGQSPTDGDAQASEPNVSRHDKRNADNVAIADQLKYDEGETSFSCADSFITYSGPIPFSGSISHRSDGSATSGKSFAFPVLQSEWNSSPVRMAKGDRRLLRKHKDWKSQLLCCKF